MGYKNLFCDECDEHIGFIYDTSYIMIDTKLCSKCKDKDGGIKK
jgi:hypothetical protein